jgi:hypothetical protein
MASTVEKHVESTSRDAGALKRNNRDVGPPQLELLVMGKPSKRVTFEGGSFWDLVRIFLHGKPQNPSQPLFCCMRSDRNGRPSW